MSGIRIELGVFCSSELLEHLPLVTVERLRLLVFDLFKVIMLNYK